MLVDSQTEQQLLQDLEIEQTCGPATNTTQATASADGLIYMYMTSSSMWISS